MRRRLRLLRRLSLVLLLLWMGVVGASFLRRQMDRKAPSGRVQLDEDRAGRGEQPVRVHRGFVYTDTVGVEPNFRIAAEETVEFASGWFELRNVEVSLYHGGEVVYGLSAREARLNRDLREAVATGDVRLSLGGGVAVHAVGFSLKGADRVLTSEGPATFAGAGLGGLAGGLICRLADNSISLVGGVSLVWRSDPDAPAPMIILAPRAEYSRALATVDFPEGARVLRGGLSIEGASAQAQLRDAEGDLQSLAFGAPVTLAGEAEDGAILRGRSGRLALTSLDDGRLRLTAEPAAETGWVALHVGDAAIGWRELNAWRLVGEGSRDRWEWLEAQGLACVIDYPASGATRELTSEAVRVEFSDGRPSSAVATGRVRVSEREQWAEGERLAFSLQSRAFNLRPSPTRRVAIGTTDVSCVCDELESGEGGSIVARGNVSGVLRRGALWGAGEAPVRFAAQAALVAANGERLDLDGDARLWQGDRLVRARHIDFVRASEVLNARENVVTLARLSPESTTPGELMQLKARSLHYEHRGGLAVYEGDVLLEDSRSTTSCQRLTVTLGASGQVLLATLEGGVTMTERATTRVIKGQSARFDTVRDVLEILGKPVMVTEPGGNVVKASRLEWRRGTETLMVTGEEGAPSETIYHPTSTPPAPGGAEQRARRP